MIVEIDLFSGRPNPKWEVDDGVRREVLEIEAALEAVVGRGIELPGLGYRGFVYEAGGETRRAFGGLVERGRGVFEDGKRVIEWLLLASMPEEFGEFRERVAGQLQ